MTLHINKSDIYPGILMTVSLISSLYLGQQPGPASFKQDFWNMPFFGKQHTRVISVNTPQEINTVHLQLRSLLQEHALGGATLFINRFDGSPAYQASYDAAQQNSQAIADFVGKYYGNDAENAFLPLWKSHIDLLVQYTDAVKNNDGNSKQQALNGLNSFTDQMVSFFQQQDQNLPTDTMRNLLTDHIQMEQSIIDAHASGDFSRQYDLMHQAFVHAGDAADQITQIAQQKSQAH